MLYQVCRHSGNASILQQVDQPTGKFLHGKQADHIVRRTSSLLRKPDKELPTFRAKPRVEILRSRTTTKTFHSKNQIGPRFKHISSQKKASTCIDAFFTENMPRNLQIFEILQSVLTLASDKSLRP